MRIVKKRDQYSLPIGKACCWQKRVIFFLAMTFTLPFLGVATPRETVITGVYHEAINSFEGVIEYPLEINENQPLQFHLPPNWYASTDRRRSFLIKNSSGEYQSVPKEDLTTLKKYTHPNIHLPHSIEIKSVRLNDAPVLFELLDNPYLAPQKSISDAILLVRPPENLGDQVIKIKIEFTTIFNELPDGFKRILYDFVPRRMVSVKGKQNRRGNVCERRYIKGVIDLDSQSDGRRLEINEWQSCLTVLIDEWDIGNDQMKLSLDDYVLEQQGTIVGQLTQTREFLVREGWINDYSYKILIWDGGVTASGRYLFLPRRNLNYNNLFFFKYFGIEYIKAIVSAEINKSLLLDQQEYPWVLPAIQSEIIRSYFNSVFEGNTRMFPTTDWFNPDFNFENSLNQWIQANNEKTVVAADSPIDLSYYDSIYHPWYEKGYHLMWMVYGGDTVKRERRLQMTKTALREDAPPYPIEFSESVFFNMFNDPDGIGKKWLSEAGRVDYKLEDVTLHDTPPNRVQLSISNSGTLSPPLEIEFVLEDASRERVILEDGVGNHDFTLRQNPRQILLDPDLRLLEDNILNNSWKLPVKVRPVGDFRSADRWVITPSPVIGGNTFDKNALGIGVNLGFLDETRINVKVWSSSLSAQPLWESEVSHIGFPFKGTELLFAASQLKATQSLSIGFEHQLFRDENLGWFGVTGQFDHLNAIEANGYYSAPSQWRSIELSGEYPLFRSAFFEWRLETNLAKGVSDDRLSLSYDKHEFINHFLYEFSNFELLWGLYQGSTQGDAPAQKKYAMGGVEGLSGYPRDTKLLFDTYHIWEVGFGLPEMFEYSDTNLARAAWVNHVKPTVLFHWAKAEAGITYEQRDFMDIELLFDIDLEILHNKIEDFQLAIAYPINDPDYRDFRIVFLSKWVF